MSRAIALIALTGAAALAAAPALAGGEVTVRKPQKRTVGVHDNYYGPKKLTVNLRSRITWVWEDDANDVHDLELTSGPKGFKRFQTEPGAIGFRYARTLTKPGTYRFLCTFHGEDNMRMTIIVRR